MTPSITPTNGTTIVFIAGLLNTTIAAAQKWQDFSADKFVAKIAKKLPAGYKLAAVDFNKLGIPAIEIDTVNALLPTMTVEVSEIELSFDEIGAIVGEDPTVAYLPLTVDIIAELLQYAPIPSLKDQNLMAVAIAIHQAAYKSGAAKIEKTAIVGKTKWFGLGEDDLIELSKKKFVGAIKIKTTNKFDIGDMKGVFARTESGHMFIGGADKTLTYAVTPHADKGTVTLQPLLATADPLIVSYQEAASLSFPITDEIEKALDTVRQLPASKITFKGHEVAEMPQDGKSVLDGDEATSPILDGDQPGGDGTVAGTGEHLASQEATG